MRIRWIRGYYPEDARVVKMPPSEYIKRISLENRFTPGEYHKYIDKYNGRVLHYPPFREGSFERIEDAIGKKGEMDMPWIVYRDDRTVREQEGFHRALVAKALDIKMIPVSVSGRMPRRWVPPVISIADEIGEFSTVAERLR